ncbi:MAG: hypothetical protein OXF79_09370 [Chloroflexi bacterium]|nr:hypothetical protein [Chloroflexota bacterium]
MTNRFSFIDSVIEASKPRNVLLSRLRKRDWVRSDAAVRIAMLELLRQRVNDPRFLWEYHTDMPSEEFAAGELLKNSGYLNVEGGITLAGIDYYRRETASPVLTWLKANWFAVVVAAATVSAAVCGPFFDFLWRIVLP